MRILFTSLSASGHLHPLVPIERPGQVVPQLRDAVLFHACTDVREMYVAR